MPRQNINIGSAPNDGTGDTLRESFDKTNDNFIELYNSLGGGGGFLFQIGNDFGNHLHHAFLPLAMAQSVMFYGPTVTIPTSTSMGAHPEHSHTLELGYNRITNTFEIVGTTTEAGHNHNSYVRLVGKNEIAAAEYQNMVLSFQGSYSLVWTPPVFLPRPYLVETLGSDVYGTMAIGAGYQHNTYFRYTNEYSDIEFQIQNDNVYSVPESQFWRSYDAKMPIGGTIRIARLTGPIVTIAPTDGVITTPPGIHTINKINGVATITKVDNNHWDVVGDINTTDPQDPEIMI